jgi:hypothetical protein
MLSILEETFFSRSGDVRFGGVFKPSNFFSQVALLQPKKNSRLFKMEDTAPVASTKDFKPQTVDELIIDYQKEMDELVSPSPSIVAAAKAKIQQITELIEEKEKTDPDWLCPIIQPVIHKPRFPKSEDSSDEGEDYPDLEPEDIGLPSNAPFKSAFDELIETLQLKKDQEEEKKSDIDHALPKSQLEPQWTITQKRFDDLVKDSQDPEKAARIALWALIQLGVTVGFKYQENSKISVLSSSLNLQTLLEELRSVDQLRGPCFHVGDYVHIGVVARLDKDHDLLISTGVSL